jgi:DNA-directed RNA polymerase beta' subunit
LKTEHELIEKFPEGIESSEYTLELKKASSEKVQTILNISQIKKTAQDELNSLKLDSVINKAELDKILQKFPNSFESKTGPELLEHLLKEIIPENEVVEIEKLLDLEENKYNYGFEKKLALNKYFLNKNLKPEWLILHSISVLPPNLRPLNAHQYNTFLKSNLDPDIESDLILPQIQSLFSISSDYSRVINPLNRLKLEIENNFPTMLIQHLRGSIQKRISELYQEILNTYGWYTSKF